MKVQCWMNQKELLHGATPILHLCHLATLTHPHPPLRVPLYMPLSKRLASSSSAAGGDDDEEILNALIDKYGAVASQVRTSFRRCHCLRSDDSITLYS